MKHFQLASVYNVYNVYNVRTMCVQCVYNVCTMYTMCTYIQYAQCVHTATASTECKTIQKCGEVDCLGSTCLRNFFTAIITSFEGLSHLLLWTSQNIVIIIVIVLCYILIVQRLIGWCCRLCFCAHSPPFQLYT